MSNINLNTRVIFIHIPKTAGTSMESVFWNRAKLNTYEGHLSNTWFNEHVDVKKYFKWCFVRNPWSRLLSGYDYVPDFKSVYPTFESFVHIFYKYRKEYQKLDFYRFTDPLSGWGNGLDIPDLPPGIPRAVLVSQKSFITVNGKTEINFVGRFETLQSDWTRLCHIISERVPLLIRSTEREKEWKESVLSTIKLPELNIRGTRKSLSADTSNTSHFVADAGNGRGPVKLIFDYADKPWQEYYTKEMIDLVGEIYEQDVKEFNYKFSDGIVN